MAVKLIDMDDLIDRLEESFPELEYEADRAWLWVTSDLSPHRNKCQCEQCLERARIRKGLCKDGLGFIYAKNGHVCPSGAEGYFGHHCMRPTRFKRRDKKGAQPGTETDSQTPEVSDEQLLALLEG